MGLASTPLGLPRQQQRGTARFASSRCICSMPQASCCGCLALRLWCTFCRALQGEAHGTGHGTGGSAPGRSGAIAELDTPPQR